MDLGSPITIPFLGFLVLVFGAILRRRATDQLQFWFFGWVFLLAHLLANLVCPRIGMSDPFILGLSSSATILAGMSFAFAASTICPNSRHIYLAAIVATPTLIYANAVAWHIAAKPLLFSLIAAEIAGVFCLFWVVRRRVDQQVLCTVAPCIALALLAAKGVAEGEFTKSVYVIQGGLFVISGVLLRMRFGRWSIGTITTTVGFLAWGGSLLSIQSYAAHGVTDSLFLGTAWNAPAYVVALGMILTVLEEQMREAAEASWKLAHQAHHDALTGLPNRLLLDDRLSQALARARRTKTRAALMCIDLDRFKQVNDTFGHYVGDLYLQNVVARLSSRIRETDTLARTGGDEFIAVIGNFESPTVAAKVAENLLETLREPLMIQGCPLPATACIGIAIYPEDASNAEALRRAADQALYRAKSRGRNQYDCFSTDARDALDIQRHLRRAIDEGGFEVVYQPQFLKDGTIACVEALLRFRHPTLGMIPPSRFIPIAEESGLIVAIGDWVLRQVCRQVVEWKKQADASLKAAVNVSALQFNRIDFADSVARILSETGVDPELIELELTEGLVMNNVEDSSRQMKSLKLLGVQIAVDDFGTGYSSLSYLHRLPIDKLKIDRSFVEKIAEPGGTRPIVDTIMSLARSLSMRTVAEGVETQAQLDIICQLDCDLIQGFLFSRPVSELEVLELLRRRKRSWLARDVASPPHPIQM